jgi:hypothetical protein
MKTADFLKRKIPHPAGRSKPTVFSLAQGAKMAGITEGLLVWWISTEHFIPSIELPGTKNLLGWNCIVLTEEDVKRLRKMVEHSINRTEPSWVDDGKQENFTVAQVASLWELSPDTIQRLFEDEPGVVKLGDKNPRGRRRRITLRIPRDVMNRVKRRLANK